MKRTFFSFILGVLVAVSLGVIAQPAQQSFDRSVEVGVAEFSQDTSAFGLAVPASGGSEPTTVPGCFMSIDNNLLSVGSTSTGTTTAYWEHGVVDNNREATYIPRNEPVTAALGTWSVTDACMAYCDLNVHTCDPADDTQWAPVDIASANTLALHAGEEANESYLVRLGEMGTAHAGKGGGGGSPCTVGMSPDSSSFTFTANRSGNFAVGMAPTYSATYGDHHSVTREAVCYFQVSIDSGDQPNLESYLPIDTNIYGLGSDIALDTIIGNLGTATFTPATLETGEFGYEIKLDFNNASPSHADFASADRTFASAGTVGPLGPGESIDISELWPASDLVTGVHGVQVCADRPTSMLTESHEGDDSNCRVGTIEVTEVDIVSYSFDIDAVYGQPLEIYGVAYNDSPTNITTPFETQFDVRPSGGATTSFAGSLVSSVDSYDSEGFFVTIDHEASFGTERNLEFEAWVDVTNTVTEEAPDNVYPDTNGNNDSISETALWTTVTLHDPDVRPVPSDRNGSATGYWGPFGDTLPASFFFDILNETTGGPDITTPFEVVLALDYEQTGAGSCGVGVSYTHSCVDETFVVNLSGITGASQSLQVDRPNTTSLPVGNLRAQLYVDTQDDLAEGSEEADNETGWIDFEVQSFTLPGVSSPISLIVTHTDTGLPADLVQTGSIINVGWDIGTNEPGACFLEGAQFDRINLEPYTTDGTGDIIGYEVIGETDFTLECLPNDYSGPGGAPINPGETVVETIRITGDFSEQ